MKNRIIYICAFVGIIIVLSIGFYFGLFLPKKARIAEQQKQKQEQEAAAINESNLSYNQVFNSKREPSDTPGYYNSEYNGKVITWQAKISAYFTQITGIKFCVVDKDHQNVDIGKYCDFFWAGSKDLRDADNLAINPSWDGFWAPYVLNYYKVPFNKNMNYYNETYTIKGIVEGLDCSVTHECIPDIEIISITNEKEPPKKGIKEVFKPVAFDKETCDKLKGKWGQRPFDQKYVCNIPTSDSGKKCLDEAECQGSCLAEVEEDEFGIVTSFKSKCSEWTIVLGCNYYMQDGTPVHICRD